MNSLIPRNKTEPSGRPNVARHTFNRCLLALGLAWSVLAPDTRAAQPPVSVAAIEIVPQLQISGTVGALFRIEATENLSQSNSWVILKNLVLPSSPYLFLDTTAPGHAHRFYRVMTGPKPPQLAWINPGTFLMGSPLTENERAGDEGPQTSVTISKGFWMSKYLVTQVDYLSLTGVNPSAFPDDLNRPVDSVSQTDAIAYCGLLTEEERQAGRLPAGYAYRLPTEAEWEYAARAGTTTRFSYGDDPGYTMLDTYAWYGSNSSEMSHPVGTKSPNPWGLYDMHGNVWEWCSDFYVGFYVGGNLTDPLGPLVGAGWVIRGGSWKGLNRFCRSASRSSSLIAGPNVGFRVVLAQTQP